MVTRFILFGLTCIATVSCDKTDPAPAQPPKGFKVKTEIFTKAGSPYTLKFTNKSPLFQTVVKQTLVNIFFTVYPKLVEYFKAHNPAMEVQVTIDPAYDGAAYASGGGIVISANYINANPGDTDILIHELTHIVQAYRSSTFWIQEGIADYARHKFAVGHLPEDWSHLGSYSSDHKLENGYRETARFFVWLVKRVNGGEELLLEVDGLCRSGTYSPAIWWDRTGMGATLLWDVYSRNPALGGATVVLDINEVLPAGGALMSGVYKVINSNSALALDVNRSSRDNGIEIIQWTYSGDANQQWEFIHQGENHYKIIAGHSGKVLEIPVAVITQAGAGAVQMDWTGKPNQLWQIVSNDNTWRIVNVHSGFVLDVNGGASAGGATVVQTLWENKASQRWNIDMR